MNNATLFRFAEGGALLLAFLVALGLAVGPRRWFARKAGTAAGAATRWFWAAAGNATGPLLTLGLGWLLLRTPEALGVSWAGLVPATHRSAWYLFWMIMVVFELVETTFMQFAALRLPALLRGMVRVLATAGAAFFVLRFELGWNITPLLASTALVTAVVGFALQGVLGNLLAGMSLNLTRALAAGDWVAIDDLEGQVQEMNWRETWLVTLENVPVRIPNSRVADARLRHLSRPAEPRRCSLYVEAGYDAPPDEVLAALLESARAVPEVRTTPAPQAFVLDFKSHGVGYELRVWLDDYPRRTPILGEVRRHVWYRFRRRGIDIPYPVTDQVLNDFLARAVPAPAAPAEDPETPRRVAGLLRSDFAAKVLAGPDGQPLVPEADLAAWAGRLASRLYARGEILYRQGDAGDCCHVVLAGRLAGRVRHRAAERETRFEVGPGAVVGEMSLMTGLPRMAEIEVAESAELLEIPAPEFAALLGRHAGLVERLGRLVAERTGENRRQLEDLMAPGAPPVAPAISREGIVQRFWRLLGAAAGPWR